MFSWGIKAGVLFFLLSFTQGAATEYQPWLGNSYEFEFRTSLIYESYSKLAVDSHLKPYSSDNVFLNASLSNATPDFGVELEAVEVSTRQQKGKMDQLKLTGRYSWLDDLAGDSWSLIPGFSYRQAFKNSLKDISCFHHGLYEGEVFLSFGKEKSLDTYWHSRWWSLIGIGMAERGSLWLRFQLVYERCWWDKHRMRLFLHSLWGGGNKKLSIHHFNGYGSIRHRSVDLGLRYTYSLDYFGTASLEYSYRIYAQNFPIYTHHLLAQLLYTFGL